jgi:hypothetical protein
VSHYSGRQGSPSTDNLTTTINPVRASVMAFGLAAASFVGFALLAVQGDGLVALVLAACLAAWPLYRHAPEWIQLAAILGATWTGLYLGGTRLSDAVTLLAVASLVLSRTQSFSLIGPTWMAGAVISITAVVGALVTGGDYGLRPLWQFLIAMFAVPLITASVTSTWPRRAIMAFVLGVAIGSVLAVLQVLHLSDISAQLVERQSFANSGRALGLAAHSNQLGLASIMALPLALSLTRRSRAWWGIVLVLIGATMAAGSRAGLIGLVFASLAYLWFQRRLTTRRVLRFASLGACVIALLLSLGFDATIDRFVDQERVERSNAGRSELLARGTEDFLDSPLVGWGFDEGDRELRSHNLYLEVARSVGLLGLTVFLIYCWWILKAVRRAPVNVYISGAGAGFVGWLAAAPFHNGLFQPFLMIPAGIVLGLVWRTRGEPPDDLKPDTHASATTWMASRPE